MQVARLLIGALFDTIGVTPACRDDVELALTEACTNVVRHARAGRPYQVNVDVTEYHCVIAVMDHGVGFDHAESHNLLTADREFGRGLPILVAVTDSLDIDSVPGRGTTVRFTKALAFDPAAPTVSDALVGDGQR